jgi:D-alanyl-lipoteichoic acid acyltransferase DltB (MBOAT superfamily)
MGIVTPEFFALVAGALLLFHASGAPGWRRSVLMCASAVFALSHAGNDLFPAWTFYGTLTILPLAAFILAGFLAVRMARRLHAWSLALALCLLYALLRYLPAGMGVSDRVTTIGLSYILFRILHLLFDNAQGAVASAPALSDYLAYVLFFPTLSAGPIWRYEEYRDSLDAAGKVVLDGDRVFAGFSRILNGCLKVLVLAWACDIVHAVFVWKITATHYILADNTTIPGQSVASSAAFFSLAAIAYLLYFYFDFSGYMDIVIGVGALFGLSLPENFNAPFQSADIIDFWNRWHITLSQWMQRYFFTTLVAWLSRRFLGAVKIQFLGAVGYLAVFLAVGVWHGADSRFICFGLVLGFAASATKLWDSWLFKLVFPGKTGKAIRGSAAYRRFMNAAALFTVSLALSPLWVDADMLLRIDAWFVANGLAAGLLTTGSLRVLDDFFRELFSALDRPGRLRIRGSLSGVLASLGSELWVAFRCLAVFGILAARDSDLPAFLYQGF